MGTEILWREAQRDLLLERIGVDGDRARGDDILAAVEEERHRFAFHARSLNRQIDFELTAAKGEFRRADLGDAHVGEAFGLADADGEHRHRQRRAAVQSFLSPLVIPSVKTMMPADCACCCRAPWLAAILTIWCRDLAVSNRQGRQLRSARGWCRGESV